MDQAGSVSAEINDGLCRVTLSGRLDIDDVMRLRDTLGAQPDDRPMEIDMGAVTYFDTAIAWVIAEKQQRMSDAGQDLALAGLQPNGREVLDLVIEDLPKPDEVPPPKRGIGAWLARFGEQVSSDAAIVAESVNLLGLFLHRLARSIVQPRRFRLTALVHHCEAVGFGAVPIVALMSFLIGVVLAFQGASQLRQFGAEVFVVDLIAISVLRELGILLTAIIVAGRTASSFTAAIGSMKMREEIDAMQTLGIDPTETLIVPRVLALVLMLPILGLISDLAGLFGGALMSWVELQISPATFITRLVEGTDVSHFLVGLSKAPFFALLIGLIGCQAGLRVKGTAESLGKMTSSAVVAAIFAVIVLDALFSIFFAQLGV